MANYKKGDIVKGCVTGIENYGIFIGLDNYYSGLIHISEISDDFVKNINDYVKIGETIKAKVLDVNQEEFHLKLSIKGVDYRFNRRNNNKIKETTKGFSTLEKKLNSWITAKLEEISEVTSK